MNKSTKAIQRWWMQGLILLVFTSPPLYPATEIAFADSEYSIWDEQAERLEDVEGDLGDIDLEIDELVDDTQEQASHVLLSAATWFDDFFDDTRFIAEENKTRAKIRLETSYHEEDGFDISPSVRWRIHLPKLEEKLNLVIFAADDGDDPSDSNISSDLSSANTTRSDLTAALQYFVKTTDKYNISTTAGGSFDYLYVGARFRYFKSFKRWQGRFIERLRYYTDDGWENYNSLDFEREFLEKFLFRNTTSLYVREDEDSLDHSISFSLFQFLTDTRALAYEWTNNFETDPSHRLADLILRLRYRQQGHREWLMYEVSPWVNFPEEDGYEAQFGLRFTLEAKFGYSDSTKLKNIFHF
ncbi:MULTISPECIES: hypothetical protein [Desulfosediminicola]|uniref:hypothetical protein n=1 Tax=Desulfosediminicola TaxID=2886823 RepID=UPI0010ACFEB5|nr:hypothetical protein [Desulfosediminicola ganghwensis]